jgi:uncharacterized protein DUF6647
MPAFLLSYKIAALAILWGAYTLYSPLAGADQAAKLPSAYWVVGQQLAVGPNGQVEPNVVRSITFWLSQRFDLPFTNEQPTILFVPFENLRISLGSTTDTASTTIASYHDNTQTIHLLKGWTGATPTEMSVLVHELVHHLQNIAGMKFACEEEREILAYEAQRRWLALYGHDLFQDFQIDAFTVFARSHCLM